MRGLQHHILVLLWCLVGWRDDQSWMYSPFFSFGYGRCRTVARSLHEHTVKTTFVQGPKVHKCRQIKTNQKTHKTHNQDDPQIPQPDLRFVRKNSKPDTPRGKSPNNKTHNKDLPRDTADLPLCHTQKHAKINYPPRHSVKHRNRSTVHSFVGIEKTCTRSRAYENCLSQRPLKGQKSSILCW